MRPTGEVGKTMGSTKRVDGLHAMGPMHMETKDWFGTYEEFHLGKHNICEFILQVL